MADAAGQGVAVLFIDPDELAAGAAGAGFIFHRMIEGETLEVVSAEEIAARIADMGEPKFAVAEHAKREGGADAEMWAELKAELRDGVVGLEGDQLEIGRIGRIANELFDQIHRALGGFGAAGQATDSVSHSVKIQRLIAQEAIFILPSYSADVG